jgi:hypothetical protein
MNTVETNLLKQLSRRLLFFIMFTFFLLKGIGQNVGIGTTTPLARLHVVDSSVIFSSAGELDVLPGNPGVSGPGRRMMWYPAKAAFRSGYVPWTEWDKNNIGTYSVAFGWGTIASGIGTTATGYQSSATGVYATAMGYQTQAKALASFAIGNNNDIADNPDPNNPLPLDRIFQVGNGNFSTTRTNALTILRNGNVGIGHVNPVAPLSFSSTVGEKITFYGDGAPHYGIGVQPYLLQFHTDAGASDIAFGYGSSNAFTETMRIKGNGNLGIGTSVPEFKLDVADRIRIRSGGGFSSAGLYLNNNNNSQLSAFIGMDDDTHVGFWGSGIGWRFTMNTQTGALKINGSEGAAGQVLRSNGPAAPPTWSAPVNNSLYNSTVQVFATDSIPVTEAFVWTPIPGMTYTFNATGNVKVIVMFNVRVLPGFCLSCNHSNARIGIYVDGNQSRYFTQDIQNSTVANFSATYLVQLGAGSHTIDLRGMKTGPSLFFAYGGSVIANNMILQIIPE